jgi:hypothetical protein
MEKRKLGLFGLSVLVFWSVTSCISMQGREMTTDDKTEMRVIGNVTVKWVDYNFLNIRHSDLKLEIKAVSKLKEEAQRQGYEGNMDIKNIRVEGNFNPLTLVQIVPLFAILGNFQTVIATGDVVEFVDSSNDAGINIIINN